VRAVLLKMQGGLEKMRRSGNREYSKKPNYLSIAGLFLHKRLAMTDFGKAISLTIIGVQWFHF
jgi:hypothetical protein